MRRVRMKRCARNHWETSGVTDGDEHARVVAFLSDPAAHGGAAVEVAQTHGALVFLAGDRAYKLKRDISYDYLDFSTPERRRAMLQRELDLNRAAAPEIYDGLVAVTRTATGGFELGGVGQPVEWVLRMRRFPAEAELAEIARRDGIDPALADAIGAVVARYHADAAPAATDDGAGRIGRVIADILSSLADMEDALDPAAVARLRGAAEAALRRVAPLLDARARAGFVRRCHGDLHLGNLVVIKGRPVPFDALEFDERLATTDVLYDLAFLLMDLMHAGLRPAANRVLGRYLAHADTPDHHDGLAALPLFLALRAAIRAMVAVQRARLAKDPAEGRAEARGYLADAAAYLDPPGPALVAVGGLSGSGKTTLAAGLAPGIGAAPGAVHLRSDIERKIMFGVDPLEPLPAEGYRSEVGAQVYERLRERAARALRAGHSVLLDAVHDIDAERAAAEALAARAGVPFAGLWLEADPQALVARVSARRGDASDADAAVVRRQLEAAPAAVDWHTVDASGSAPETQARAREVLAPLLTRS